MAQTTSGIRAILSNPKVYAAFQLVVGSTRVRTELIQTYVKPEPGLRVLDVGCGHDLYALDFHLLGRLAGLAVGRGGERRVLGPFEEGVTPEHLVRGGVAGGGTDRFQRESLEAGDCTWSDREEPNVLRQGCGPARSSFDSGDTARAMPMRWRVERYG